MTLKTQYVAVDQKSRDKVFVQHTLILYFYTTIHSKRVQRSEKNLFCVQPRKLT
jgi:hypothetical protein